MDGILTSRHARTRLRQRGVRDEVVECVLVHGDLETPSHGRTRVRLSARKADELASSREVTPDCVRKARRLVLVVAHDETVVTAYWANPRLRMMSKVPASPFADAA